ncbi:hypothetical protein ACGFZP_37645 [Kitasatospora sp. NPDC048239]|uniref:hypothetical protein n=1 Tax=Kitasatospora sp. NPDC048239 TaxID=3364046 RepID=UPI0037120CCC
MTHQTLARLRRAAAAGTVTITASGPATVDAVRDRETGLKPHFGAVTWTAPPAYRAFLAAHDTFACRRENGHGSTEFVIVGNDDIVDLNSDLVHMPEGVDRGDGRRLSTNHLVGFALADASGEAVWCFDVTQPDADGEYPVYHYHQDADRGIRYLENGDWENPADTTPDFPSFTAWLDAMAQAFTATEPPAWLWDLGEPHYRGADDR